MPAISAVRRFRERHTRLIRGSLLLIVFALSFGGGLAYASWAMVCLGGRCPSAQLLDAYQPRQTSKLLAIDGRFIAELGLERRTLVKLADVPKEVQSAFVTTEDRRFYQHAGVDWQSVPRAVVRDLRSGDWSEGFSTITMQLARNIFPERISREKSLVRKLKEIKVARAIEQRYPKDRILELYLNQIYFGNGAYGVETASQRYFGKSVRELNLAEGATLASIPKSPTRYNPRKSPEAVVQRRNSILELMHQANVITDADASLAKAYPLRLAEKVETGDLAPYFVEYVREQLDDKFGAQLYEQGLTVYTSLDIDMQAGAERALERQLNAIEGGKFGAYHWPTYEAYVAKAQAGDEQSTNSPYLQGAFIAMDPRTGGIRALVGGRDFDDNKFDRATQALRQPGSTFNPIVYSDAVENGRPMSYLVDDTPLDVPMGDGTTWHPQNFDGGFEGKIPMRRALYESRNVATIRLGMELGEQSVIDMARKFGLTSQLPAYPSIHIGADEVYPIEMVAAYTAFSNLGTRVTPQAIVKVVNAKGEVLWEPEGAHLPVLSQEEAWLMVTAMKDVVQRGTAAGSVGAQIHFPAGGKTGTTNDGSDVWFIGYTTDLVAGVWMGFDRPKKIKANAQGGVLAAPAWVAFMNEVYHRQKAPGDWATPVNMVTRSIDVTTNMLASPYCPANVVGHEWFIPGTDPIYVCDVHTAPDTSNLTTPVDSTGGVKPPSTTVIAPARPLSTTDSIARTRTVFPRRDSLGRIIPDTVIRRNDTTRKDTTRKDTTLKPRPIVKPDTTHRVPHPR